MILADTSIWIDHLRRGDARLQGLLEQGLVAIHPFVIGELACGTLTSRARILDLLHALPKLSPASDDEALYFIDQHRLIARGIGYIDVHLLAAVAINGARMWTRDKRLRAIAEEIELAYGEAKH